jgi:hypothetical protein
MNSVKTPDVDKVDAAVRARMQDSLDDPEPYSAGFPSTHGGDASAIMVGGNNATTECKATYDDEDSTDAGSVGADSDSLPRRVCCP